jgi:hypothetical protein
MALFSATCPLPKNQMLQRHRTAFSPSNISGLSLWLKADAGVSLSGSDVTLWADQSGNGRNATPVLASPTYNSSDLNGKPTISLSSIVGETNQSLQIDGNPMGAFGSTAFVVNYVDPDVFGFDPNGALLGNFGNASDGSHWPYGLTNSVYDSFATDARKNDLGLPTGITNWNIYSVYSQDNDWKLFCNGTEFYSDEANVYSNVIANDTSLYIGMQNNAGTDQIFKGKVAEVVIYNRVLTGSERQKVEEYLMSKYDITPIPSEIPVASTASVVIHSAYTYNGTYTKKIPEQSFPVYNGHNSYIKTGICYSLGNYLLLSPNAEIWDDEVGAILDSPFGVWKLIDSSFDTDLDSWVYNVVASNSSTNANYIPTSAWSPFINITVA